VVGSKGDEIGIKLSNSMQVRSMCSKAHYHIINL